LTWGLFAGGAGAGAASCLGVGYPLRLRLWGVVRVLGGASMCLRLNVKDRASARST
jgi:hypothetical protein